MRTVYVFSHMGGAEILRTRYSDIDREIEEVIQEVEAREATISDKDGEGEVLYASSNINQQFRRAFENRQYRELRHRYKLTIPNSDIAIPGAFRQIDFAKGRVLVEVQLDECFDIFSDIARFQHFCSEGVAEVGVEIVPCYALYTKMFLDVHCEEEQAYGIEQLRSSLPAVPVKVILVDVDESG
jgi:hypothetical protein